MLVPSAHDSSVATDIKERDIYEMPVTKFKIVITRKVNESQENMDGQFTQIRKAIYDGHEKFSNLR